MTSEELGKKIEIIFNTQCRKCQLSFVVYNFNPECIKCKIQQSIQLFLSLADGDMKRISNEELFDELRKKWKEITGNDLKGDIPKEFRRSNWADAILDAQLAADQLVLAAKNLKHQQEKQQMIEWFEKEAIDEHFKTLPDWQSFKDKYTGKQEIDSHES